MHILIIAGGSGGHIFPALGVYDKLSKNKVTFMTTWKKLDTEILKKNKAKYYRVFSGKLRRYFSLKNFIDPFFIFLGLIQSFFLLLYLRPQVIFSKGGFLSVPIIYAGKLLHIPIVIHESDAQMGLANRLAIKKADKVLVAFDDGLGENVGLPIREQAFFPPIKNPWLNKFPNKKTIILAFFGSQGATELNNIFVQEWPKLAEKANIIWVFGKDKMPNINFNNSIYATEFLYADFFEAIHAADLVLARSGSSALEIAAAKKAMLLFPLQSAANDHQNKNADYFVKQKAAQISMSAKLVDDTLALLADLNKREEMAKNAYKLVKKEAAAKIAEIILAVGKK